jgi:acetyl-CoA C-acetyltransferase
MSKYAAGVYSTAAADWSQNRWQSLPKIKPAWDVLDAHDGAAVAESFTIQPGKEGEVGTVIARVGQARMAANSSDPATCAALREATVFGRPIVVESGEKGVNRFRFT